MLFSPASKGFSLVWLLAFTKSFAWLIRRVVGLFTPRELRDGCLQIADQIPADGGCRWENADGKKNADNKKSKKKKNEKCGWQ